MERMKSTRRREIDSNNLSEAQIKRKAEEKLEVWGKRSNFVGVEKKVSIL